MIKINTRKTRNILLFSALIICTLIVLFLQKRGKINTWYYLLINNYFLVSVAIGNLFFMCIQNIIKPKWSTDFVSISTLFYYLLFPVAIVFMFSLSGFTYAIQIQNPEEQAPHLNTFLNSNFYYGRSIFYFIVILFTGYKLLNLDKLTQKKKLIWSNIFLISVSLTFLFATIDWIITLNLSWISTLFVFKNLFAALYLGVAVFYIMLVILQKTNRARRLAKNQQNSFRKYFFILSIVYGYLWFSQFMLIWYSNIPVETVYFKIRIENYSFWFYSDIILNFFIPFILMFIPKLNKTTAGLLMVSVSITIGRYVDITQQILPTNNIKAEYLTMALLLIIYAVVTLLSVQTGRKINRNHALENRDSSKITQNHSLTPNLKYKKAGIS